MNANEATDWSPEFRNEADRALRDHGKVIPLLANGRNSDFVFFTHDLDRCVKYLSDSSAWLLRIDPSGWLDQKLDEKITDHPWNEVFQTPDTKLDPDTVQNICIEISDDQGDAVKLQAIRRLVTLRDIPIGVVGILKRMVFDEEPAEVNYDPETVRARIATLTDRERSVVELVVKGEMNKSIANLLNIAVRTVEARRSKAMKKMGAKRLTELVRMWIAANGQDSK